MATLLLLRHGQSVWNLENKFTGWVDVDLSKEGIEEAKRAGRAIEGLNTKWDAAHTSRLKRAQKTLEYVLDIIHQHPPVFIDSALNERHYGDLQGLNKDELRRKFGEEQVHLWRRSFDIPPPNGECLKDTSKRTLPYYREYILKDLKAGKNIMVVAHGNSLRSIVMEIEQMTPEQILSLNLDTGVPYVYEIDSQGKMTSKKTIAV